jgi:aldehyde oxidase
VNNKEEAPVPYFVYGAACSEVEVDCLTGDHKVDEKIITEK